MDSRKSDFHRRETLPSTYRPHRIITYCHPKDRPNQWPHFHIVPTNSKKYIPETESFSIPAIESRQILETGSNNVHLASSDPERWIRAILAGLFVYKNHLRVRARGDRQEKWGKSVRVLQRAFVVRSYE